MTRGGNRENFSKNCRFDRNRSRSMDIQFSANFRTDDRSSSRSRSGSRMITNRDRIRCFRKQDNFAKDCPNMKVAEKRSQTQCNY